MQLAQVTRLNERGFAMAGLLVAIALLSLALSVAMPTWKTMIQREKEEELIWRGQQYDRAIQLYRKKNAAPGVQQPARGFGQLVGGVRSKSKAKSLRVLNGRTVYSEWQFTYVPWKPGGQPTAPGAQTPGGRPGQPTTPGGRPGGSRPGSAPRGTGGFSISSDGQDTTVAPLPPR